MTTVRPGQATVSLWNLSNFAIVNPLTKPFGILEASIPTITDHLNTHLARPDVIERIKPPLTAFLAFFAMIGHAITRVAEIPPSPGYEPLLIEYGFNPIAARGLAVLIRRHGERRARESVRCRLVFEAIRFLAKCGRKRRAITRRATVILTAWRETSIIETVFNETGLLETQFISLLESVVQGREVDCRRIMEIAALVAPRLTLERGPKVSAASAAHEFFIRGVVASEKAHAYTWSEHEGDFTDPETTATRIEFGDPEFDPRPARRRLRAGQSPKMIESGHRKKD